LDIKQPLIKPLIQKQTPKAGVWPVLVLAFLLIGFAVALALVDQDTAEPFILVFLAVLAVVGVVALFGFAVGLFYLETKTPHDPLARPFLDTLDQGVIVTDQKGKILYANHYYGVLTGAQTASQVKTAERVFAVETDAAEVIFRLMRKVAEGVTAQDEIRLSIPPDGSEQARWYRLRVMPIKLEQGSASLNATLWQIADMTDERETHEKIFHELQYAVDFLDHAPAGFLSADNDGTINYINATLAEWLGYDLAEADSGHLTLDQIIAGDGAILLKGQDHENWQEQSTRIVDCDIVTKSGHHLPVRFFHRVNLDAEGRPGESRTLVLDRSPGSGVHDDARAAEVRFARFFNNAPMAIASIHRKGTLIQTNAPFSRLFGAEGTLNTGKTPIRLTSLFDEKYHSLIDQALDKAEDGQANMEPLELLLSGEDERSVRLYVLPVVDGEEGDEIALVYAFETTEQKTLERQFTQSQKMQAFGQLAGGVAHDFNNMLQAIIGNADLLLLNHKPSDPSFKFINQIKQNGNRAAALVRHLLAFHASRPCGPASFC
jgi:two-component system cell cycle sensor histidine kinase/response regulator CckA